MKTFWGPDASMQSPDMPDLLLHETAVVIFRKRMRVEKPCVVPWKETEAQLAEGGSGGGLDEFLLQVESAVL